MYQIWKSEEGESATGTHQGLGGLMEIILPFQCFELWLMIIIDERDWLTTFPKDTHIKFHSQQVGVWETGRACPQTPLACSPCKGNLPRALWFYTWVCSHKPSQSWLPLPPAAHTAFPPIRTLLPSFRCLKPPWWAKWKWCMDIHIYSPSSVDNTHISSIKSFKSSFPGGQVAKTLHSQCRGPGFNPCSGLEPTHHS